MMKRLGWLLLFLSLAQFCHDQLADFRVKPNSQADLQLEVIQLPSAPVSVESQVVASSGSSSQTKNSISFSWPERASDRQRLRSVLHDCLGVRLARLSAEGEVLDLEAPLLSNVSSLARVV